MILELIAELLEALDLSYSYLTGDTPAADRQELVDEYNELGCSIFAFLTTRSSSSSQRLPQRIERRNAGSPTACA